MMSYIFLFISVAALVAYCFLKMKRDRYYALISAALKDFDYFSTSIYMEQANNKMLLNHGMHMDKSIKQHFVSVFSSVVHRLHMRIRSYGAHQKRLYSGRQEIYFEDY